MEARNKVKYISLDYDGCLKNPAYAAALDAAKAGKDNVKSPKYDIIPDAALLIDHNSVLLAEIKRDQQASQYQSLSVMVGSNRQDISTDKGNRDGVAFPGIQNIAVYLNANFDGFLLTDAYNDLAPGKTFSTAIDFYEHYYTLRLEDHERAARVSKLDQQSGQHTIDDKAYQVEERYGKDKTKISLIYAQMHKAASDHPEEDVVFDFYDDLDEILNPTCQFYTSHPDLMPNNLSLRLHRYSGEEIEHKKEIQGQGIIDEHYYANTRFMYECGAGASFAELEANRKAGRGLLEDPNVGQELLDDSAKLDKFNYERQGQLNALKVDISRVTKEPAASNEFITRLKNLLGDLEQRIEQKLKSKFLAENEETAQNIAVETRKLLADLTNLEGNAKEKIERIDSYEKKCSQVPGWTIFKKGIALLVTAAVCMVVGAVIGLLAGQITGAIVGGSPGMLAGMALGAAAGAGAGLVLGVSIGAPILFKPSKAQNDARKLSENLRKSTHLLFQNQAVKAVQPNESQGRLHPATTLKNGEAHNDMNTEAWNQGFSNPRKHQ